jgi:diguanylate cyclase (GGDEF)-like protein
MTGLLNHTIMEQLIGDAINRTKRSKSPISLIIIDVDFFKQINDTFGHTAGDTVLKRLSQVLDHSKRSTDYIGRWGGEEFILLLSDTNLLGAAKLAEKLRCIVENHTFPHRSRLTISLGVSEYKEDDDQVSMIKRADVALYRAKHSGRNRVDIQS